MQSRLSKKRKGVAGGTAPAGGINFQAAVSAITYVYMARGKRLSWLDKVIEDVPVAVYAETGGAGDDIQVRLRSGEIVETQVKKGLKRGSKLWDSLTGMASAIKDGTINYGVLIVSPTSSNTITEKLAKDIVRLGDGRSDYLSKIAEQWIEKLNALDLPIVESCRRIRIQTKNAIHGNQADILAARSELSHLCAEEEQVELAWKVFYTDASDLIELRLRRDVSKLLLLLTSEGVRLSENKSTSPTLLLGKLTNWTSETNKHFSIVGIKKPLRIDEAWIPLRAEVQQNQHKTESLPEAIKKYQTWEERSVDSDAVTVDAKTLVRFITRAVLIGGPGMGKTTLLKKIARSFSEDNIPILKVGLKSVALRMRAGNSFEEAIFELGLDGSEITSSLARQAAFPNWLLLCDGLDECGKLQELVAAGLAGFVAGHPDCRVLVTTRPIGYDTAQISGWRHYYLIPLESFPAPAYLATLVSESVQEDSQSEDDIYASCSAELKRKETNKVVARSPLLLGIAASIIVRGGHLAATRERLFEQIFVLIEEIPNSRAKETPMSSVLLRHFLYILGWNITANPLSRIEDTLGRCAEELARETARKPLEARIDAETCLTYWQDVGMIEKIGHSLEETLVFIHKSFGEFAAARRLQSMNPDEQRDAILNIVDDPEWVEVLRFAALLGSANVIGDVLISSEAAAQRSAKRIVLANEILATADPPPRRTLREKIISESFKVVSSNQRLRALEIGKPLVAAVRRFPEELGPPAAKLLTHEQPWTYFIGWAAAVAAGPEYYRLENLADALRSCIETVDPASLRSSLSGRIILNLENWGRELLQDFIIEGASLLLEQRPSKQTDSIVFGLLNHPNLDTWGFSIKAGELLNSKGRIEAAQKMHDKHKWPQPNFDSLNESRLIAYEAIFDALDLSDEKIERIEDPGDLLYFSAFLAASSFNEVLPSDVRAWTRPFDKAATREALKGCIGVSGLDPEMLRTDAYRARNYLRASTKNSIFDITTDVDPPVIDWTRSPNLNLDVDKIETALYHPSRWMVWVAANLIENLLPQAELRLMIGRLFKKGMGNTLWVASGLAVALGKEHVDLFLERLSGSLIAGCEHLFECLRQFDLEWESELSDILNRGLKGNVKIAKEAAKLAINIAKPGQPDLSALLDDAYAYWVEYEEPYPTKGGPIPDSPRAEIIEGLMKIRLPSYAELRSYANDTRSDVRDVVSSRVMECLGVSDGPRVQFLKDIYSESMPIELLSKALESMVPLNSEELTLWERLL